jgi:DNA (cytosine-5)-methyltransferase 1
LEAAGYEVWPYVLPAVSVNAPHRRDRVWFVAKNTKCNGFVFGEPNQEGAEIREFRNACTGGSDGVYLSERPTPNPNGNGLNQCNGIDEKQPSEGGFNALGNADKGNEYGDVADTESQPSEWMRPELRKFSQQEQRESGGTHSQMGNNVADTDLQRYDKFKFTAITNKPERFNSQKNIIGEPGGWQNFPTQSPICSRNDGISSQLDGITFSKWRNESIKAAGNAIVPQVVYQIFKAIEQYETLPRMADPL